MSKTLVVSYLPRGERSNTKKLLDAFLDEVGEKSEVEVLDLIQNPPPLFLDENLIAYILREMVGEEINAKQKELLKPAYGFIAQLLSADFIVVAFPTYNFSFPAIVKAWFDMVMFRNHTFKVEDRKMIGLLGDKKALILNSSSGIYESEMMKGWEHALSLGKVEFAFMGVKDTEVVSAQGMNSYPKEKVEEVIKKASKKAREVAKKWFG